MSLAQSSEIAPLLVPVLLAICALAVLISLAMFVRKKMMKDDDAIGDPVAGFSMGNLRQLVREGKMTQAEFDAAKARIVAGAQRDTQQEAAAKKELAEMSRRREARGRCFDVVPVEDAKIIEQKPETDEPI